MQTRCLVSIFLAATFLVVGCQPAAPGEHHELNLEPQIQAAAMLYTAELPQAREAEGYEVDFERAQEDAQQLILRHLGEDTPPPPSETHAALKQLLTELEGSPAKTDIGRNIGRQMLNSASLFDEPVPAHMQLYYAELMVQGISPEFPLIVSALEAAAGEDDHDEVVRELAREALANSYALEEIHRERIERLEAYRAELAAEDPERAEVERALAHERERWPPSARVEGTTAQPDIEALRERLRMLIQT